MTATASSNDTCNKFIIFNSSMQDSPNLNSSRSFETPEDERSQGKTRGSKAVHTDWKKFKFHLPARMKPFIISSSNKTS